MRQPPYAEDLVLDVPLPAAPDITIDDGLAAQYLAISGDQLRLALSDPLAASVTGAAARIANPGLVLGLSIGQSTVATGRVIANLQYRDVALLRPVHLGETIRTVVTPRAASWTRAGTERAKVMLAMSLTTADGEELASYSRLALIPVADPGRLLVRDPEPDREDVLIDDFARFVPSTWTFGTPSARSAGDELVDPLADTVSSAREFARITQNRAAAHRDARAGIEGRRLVYGGHTIALAQASLSRVLPDLLTVLAWRSCDHLAPVFEDDLLTFRTRVDAVSSNLLDVTVTATAIRDQGETDVLRWRPVLLVGSTS